VLLGNLFSSAEVIKMKLLYSAVLEVVHFFPDGIPAFWHAVCYKLHCLAV